MLRHVLSGVGQGIVTLLLVSVGIFAMVRLTGDPLEVMLPMQATDQDRQMMASSLGLDKPLYVQYGRFLGSAVRGDFGKSFRYNSPAMGVVLQKFPATVKLATVSVAIAVLIGLPIGVLAATRRGWIDAFGKLFSLLGQSIPVFWLGLVLMLLFAVVLRLLPTSGIGGLKYYVLPALTMGWAISAGIMRLVRSSMLDVLRTDFIKMAKGKGLPEKLIVWKHGLKNAAIPVLTFTATIFGLMLGGSVVVEVVFGWPGVGQLSYQSVLSRDFPVIEAVVIFMTAIFVTINLLVDVLYAWLDPRIRYG